MRGLHKVAVYATTGGMTAIALKEWRKSQESLNAAAALLSVDRTTLLRWEKGAPHVPTYRLDEVSRVTGLSKADLRPDLFGEEAA